MSKPYRAKNLPEPVFIKLPADFKAVTPVPPFLAQPESKPAMIKPSAADVEAHRTGNLTAYTYAQISQSVDNLNVAEAAWSEAYDKAYFTIKLHKIAPLYIHLCEDAPQSVRDLSILLDWDAPLQNGAGYLARHSGEVYPVSKWNAAAKKYRAQTKRIVKAIAKVRAATQPALTVVAPVRAQERPCEGEGNAHWELRGTPQQNAPGITRPGTHKYLCDHCWDYRQKGLASQRYPNADNATIRAQMVGHTAHLDNARQANDEAHSAHLNASEVLYQGVIESKRLLEEIRESEPVMKISKRDMKLSPKQLALITALAQSAGGTLGMFDGDAHPTRVIGLLEERGLIRVSYLDEYLFASLTDKGRAVYQAVTAVQS